MAHKVPTARELILCAARKTKNKAVKRDILESKIIAKEARRFVREYRDVFIEHGKKATDQACSHLAILALEARKRR